MTTKFVSIKEFRQNIASFIQQAQTKAGSERLVVMNHSTPLFEVTPFARDATLDSLVSDIRAAKEDIKKGRVYSHRDVLKALN